MIDQDKYTEFVIRSRRNVIPLPHDRRFFLRLICLSVSAVALAGVCRIASANSAPAGPPAATAPTSLIKDADWLQLSAAQADDSPWLLTKANSTRAIAINSLTWQREPFQPAQSFIFGFDRRARVTFFAVNLQLTPGEDVTAFAAEAEDAWQRIYPLQVEHVSPLFGLGSVSAVVVRLHDEMAEDLGDVTVRVRSRGRESNRVRIRIGPPGSKPSDEDPPTTTPQPTPTATPAATPAPTAAPTPNNAPTINLTEPSGGLTVTAPARIVMGAAAGDPNHVVRRVEFYANSSLVGADETSPFSIAWENAPAGNYQITVRATFASGATAVSLSRAITVNAPPSVTITAPANSAVWTAPATINIEAAATGAAPTARVEFYQNAAPIGSDSVSPYNVLWGNVAPGTYAISARLIGADGATAAVSAPVNITVVAPNQAPAVSLTRPTTGTTFNANATIAVEAAASDADGGVARVEFFQGSTKLGEDASAPYSFDWNNVPPGTYALTARAVDDRGAASAFSNASSVTVSPPSPTPTPAPPQTPGSSGRTFYVSAGGSDGNDGLGINAAWRTIARVNASQFQPGDSVLFKRGEVWRERLTVTSSGADSQYVTFGAYGESAAEAPIIAGSNVVVAWTALANSPGTYHAALAAEPANVYVDDNAVPLAKRNSVAEVNGAADSWYRDAGANRLYVRLANSVNPATRVVEASVRDHAVYGQSKRYVRVRDLTLKHTTSYGLFAEGDNTNHWVVERNTVRNTIDAGVHTRSSTPQYGTVVQDNVIGRIDMAPASVYGRGGILLSGVRDALVRRNAVATTSRTGIWVDNWFMTARVAGATISDNVLGLNESNIQINYGNGIVVTRNKIRNSRGFGVGVNACDNSLITYNVMQNLLASTDGANYNGIDVNGASLNGRSFHNTIVNVWGNSHTLEGSFLGGSQGWQVRNNIFDARAQINVAGHNCVYLDPTVTAYTFSNNLYLSNANFPGVIGRVNNFINRDVGQWRQITADAASLFNLDPLFANVAAGDFSIAAGSSAVDAGVTIPGVNDGASGSERFKGARPDIGAIER